MALIRVTYRSKYLVIISPCSPDYKYSIRPPKPYSTCQVSEVFLGTFWFLGLEVFLAAQLHASHSTQHGQDGCLAIE